MLTQDNIKKEIPEILPTGISIDYIKSFGPLNLYLRSLYEKRTTIRIKKFSIYNLSKYKFWKYNEWFPPDRFNNVITDKNKQSILELDLVVNRLNIIISNGMIIENLSKEKYELTEELTELFKKATQIITGDKDFDFKKLCEDDSVIKYFSKY